VTEHATARLTAGERADEVGVEFHLAQILARLDVDSRTEIARALAAPGA
jgi:hypothetical protein